jgi:integrase
MICHVYKRGRFWWGKLQLDTDNHLFRFSLGTTDKRVAQAKLAEKAKEREKEAAGLLAPHSVREASALPIADVLDAFLADLKGQGRAAGTCALYRRTLAKLFTCCHWEKLPDVTARTFSEWRSRCGLSAKTLNNLLGECHVFCGWLVFQGFALANPFEHVQRINTRGTWRQYRRGLTATEMQSLLDVSPPHRRIVYLTAAFTGLRRAEMNGLQWGDVELDAEIPHIRARASTTKNRKEAVLPLHPELVAGLRALRPVDAAPFSPVLRGLIPRVPTLRKDLARAGIVFEDEKGRRADLHSLRMTYGTNLTLSGAAPRVVMELMRHSDIKLTMKIYTDAGQLPLADAVLKLPGFSVSKNVSSCASKRVLEAVAVGQQ